MKTTRTGTILKSLITKIGHFALNKVHPNLGDSTHHLLHILNQSDASDIMGLYLKLPPYMRDKLRQFDAHSIQLIADELNRQKPHAGNFFLKVIESLKQDTLKNNVPQLNQTQVSTLKKELLNPDQKTNLFYLFTNGLQITLQKEMATPPPPRPQALQTIANLYEQTPSLIKNRLITIPFAGLGVIKKFYPQTGASIETIADFTGKTLKRFNILG